MERGLAQESSREGGAWKDILVGVLIDGLLDCWIGGWSSL